MVDSPLRTLPLGGFNGGLGSRDSPDGISMDK